MLQVADLDADRIKADLRDKVHGVKDVLGRQVPPRCGPAPLASVASTGFEPVFGPGRVFAKFSVEFASPAVVEHGRTKTRWQTPQQCSGTQPGVPIRTFLRSTRAGPYTVLDVISGPPTLVPYPTAPSNGAVARESSPPPASSPRLLDAVRARHFIRRTEKAYVHWTKRYIFFHGKRHPAEMAESREKKRRPLSRGALEVS